MVSIVQFLLVSDYWLVFEWGSVLCSLPLCFSPWPCKERPVFPEKDVHSEREVFYAPVLSLKAD